MQCRTGEDEEGGRNTDSVMIEFRKLVIRLPRKSSHFLWTTHNSQVECQKFSSAFRSTYSF